MIVIPAIDIKQGRCVRLLQGRMDAETVFSDNPAAMAVQWEGLGARRLHVVDLDGAISKEPVHFDVVRAILEAVSLPIQIGGGIRDMETIARYIDAGVDRVIIGTEAIRNPALVRESARRYPGRIVIGIDARNGKVAIEGWTHTTQTSAIDLAKSFEDCGIAAIHFTDIHRDGMQTGPNIEETRKLAEAISIPVIASGGVSTIQDIENLLPLEAFGVIGVITGKALYTGTLDLREAIRLTTKRASG
jgi:phosphoribosylformimino-5-aminoimidazole carboxamide ribotide isomerase